MTGQQAGMAPSLPLVLRVRRGTAFAWDTAPEMMTERRIAMNHGNRLTAALAFTIAAALSLPAGAQSRDPIKLAIGVDAAYVPIYLSKQAKLFEKHGVYVELVQFTQGGDALDAVAAGIAP